MQADLNGDGRPEVIIATHDAKLQARPCAAPWRALLISFQGFSQPELPLQVSRRRRTIVTRRG